MKKITTIISVFILNANICFAQGEECFLSGNESKIANIAKYGMPTTNLAIALYKRDWFGAALSQGLAYGLYYASSAASKNIHKKRPCGCDGAFPSGHMVAVTASASFLHYRYGWQYGAPAYLAAAIAAADRIRIKAHSVTDMIGTFLITNLVTYIVTPRFTPDVEYLPSHWLTHEDKDAAAHKMMIKVSRNQPTLVPEFNLQKDTYSLGIRIRF